MVVVWATFPQQVVVAGTRTFVAGEHLADWLTGQPRTVARNQLQALRDAADESLLHTSVTSNQRTA